jgi:hypothetical protein
MATQKDKDQGQQQPAVIVEQHVSRKISVGEVTYETMQGEGDFQGQEVVKVTGDGIQERTLNPSDIDQLSRFFGRNVRYNANVRRNGPRATDGRGQVNHPESDSRLKGNEELRPGDPGGARRAGHSASGNGGR